MWMQKCVPFTLTSTGYAQHGPGSISGLLPMSIAGLEGQGAGHPRPLAPHPSPGRQSPGCLSEVVQKRAVAAPFGCAWSRKFTNSKLLSQSKPPLAQVAVPVLPPTETAPRAAKREALKTGLCLGCESTKVCPVCAEKEHIFSLPNANSKDAPRFFFRLSTGNINKEEK